MFFEIPKKEKELITLQEELNKPQVFLDAKRIQEINQRISSLKKNLEEFFSLKKEILDLEEISDLFSEDSKEVEEINKNILVVEKRLKDIEITSLFKEEIDKKGAILTIHPGAGGVESCDWAEMLLRMYLKFFEKRNFKYEILDLKPNEEAGIKEAVIEITSPNAYGFLKSEIGVHRLVRISPFDANRRRHTSFASVFVYPEIEDVEVKIDEKDLKIETFRASGHGGQHVNKVATAVRITHLPTGITVSCQNERSQFLNKKNALKILKIKLYKYYEEKKKEELKKYEEKKTEIAWGYQIRSYILFPYQLVKDHRTNYETTDVEAVLNGELDDFIFAYLTQKEKS
ncbi:MAG: peptide chain release factor 2 [candidate division WOR-3 bacterium]|nr:peptide chain release factor 2 [candidate division WOR-3 bacterium]MCX7836700.1 peptide chain release factor 2 [candidate division WOR-3 bacterium]MDW8113463.1 peptide chain release factor 2 [candidate division WOR-3 bacterium]